MNALTQNEPATDGQIKQIARAASDAAEKAVKKHTNLSKDGAQRVHGNPEFAGRIREAVNLALTELSVPNKYEDEEVASSIGYFSGYSKPKSVAHQIKIIHELYPDIKWGYFRPNEDEIMVQSPAEGLFAIPCWKKFAPTYGEAVEKVLAMIKKTRNGKFHNHREGQLGPDRLRQSAKSVNFFQKLGDEQKEHDILVVPAQFGIHHRGRSVRRACEVFAGNESGLGAFAIGIMLLTHPERLQHYDDLWIDCAGDEYAPGADDRFDRAPIFSFDGGRVRFGTGWYDDAHGDYGSVSAFVPQK